MKIKNVAIIVIVMLIGFGSGWWTNKQTTKSVLKQNNKIIEKAIEKETTKIEQHIKKMKVGKDGKMNVDIAAVIEPVDSVAGAEVKERWWKNIFKNKKDD